LLGDPGEAWLPGGTGAGAMPVAVVVPMPVVVVVVVVPMPMLVVVPVLVPVLAGDSRCSPPPAGPGVVGPRWGAGARWLIALLPSATRTSG